MSPSHASPSISSAPERVGNTATPEDKSNPTSPYRHIRNRHAPLTSIREVADASLQHNCTFPALPSIREVAVSAHPLRSRLPATIADADELDHTTPSIREGTAFGRHPVCLEPIREVADTESAPAKKFHTPAFLSTLLRSLRRKMSPSSNRGIGSSCGI